MFTVSTSGVKKEVVIQSFDILPLPLIPDSSLEVNIEFSTSSEISVYASETLNDEERQLWKGETIYPKGAIQFKDTNPNSIDRNYDRKIDEDDTIVFESSTAIARDSAEEIAYIDSDTGGLALILQKIDDIKRTSVRTQYNWLKNANYPVYIDPSIGPKNPSSAATLVDGVASFAWSNATNIFTSNNQDASATVHAVVPTWPLYASGFGFDVPSNSIITGIQARYERAATSTTIIDGVISLVKDGNIVGDNKAGASWPLVDAYRTVGASNDLWGVTWTPAEVNASSFGLAIKPFLPSGTGGIAYVDHVQMTIYYTIPPEITVSPSVNYGGFTRLGSNNTPVILSFTAVDDETTGVNQLAYQIRTAAGGNGTLVGNGTATSGQNKTHNISNTDPGLTDGTQTLYLRVSDGTSWSNDASFTLLRDTSESAASIPTHSPSPVTATKQFHNYFYSKRYIFYWIK